MKFEFNLFVYSATITNACVTLSRDFRKHTFWCRVDWVCTLKKNGNFSLKLLWNSFVLFRLKVHPQILKLLWIILALFWLNFYSPSTIEFFLCHYDWNFETLHSNCYGVFFRVISIKVFTLQIQWTIFFVTILLKFYFQITMEHFFVSFWSKFFFQVKMEQFFVSVWLKFSIRITTEHFFVSFRLKFSSEITLAYFFVSFRLKFHSQNTMNFFRIILIEIVLSTENRFFLCHFDWNFTLRLLWNNFFCHFG